MEDIEIESGKGYIKFKVASNLIKAAKNSLDLSTGGPPTEENSAKSFCEAVAALMKPIRPLISPKCFLWQISHDESQKAEPTFGFVKVKDNYFLSAAKAYHDLKSAERRDPTAVCNALLSDLVFVGKGFTMESLLKRWAKYGCKLEVEEKFFSCTVLYTADFIAKLFGAGLGLTKTDLKNLYAPLAGNAADGNFKIDNWAAPPNDRLLVTILACTFKQISFKDFFAKRTNSNPNLKWASS